jgi:pantoate--beta-alanine ligase
MKIVHEPDELRRACDEARAAGERVGLVPTMGALHAGHRSLVERAVREAGFVVATVFVNPTQFGPSEDFERYPRTLEADAALCRDAGAALLFAPSRDAMYPLGDETRVRVGATAAALCGAHRPIHFEGVCTVVAKLFALAGPCVAVFGRKDYQQWRVIMRMARDLFLPVEVVGAPTVREPDGLALSSRNRYLSGADRARALAIPRGLSLAHAAFAAGERAPAALVAAARGPIEAAADSVDYVELASPESAQLLAPDRAVPERALLAVAARFGGARLIDNVVLGEDPAPLATA